MVARLGLSSSQVDTEVSSARLPSDLISRESYVPGANMNNMGADLEMQQSGFTPVGAEEGEEFEVVSRNGDELEDDDDGEKRLKTLA
ncbi:hypothetical protein CPC08DRAFT_176224 [Agrocybe pediades]|nr:hypothetical protein CPC08DRAFT_176224 [Agrocybe pediades]